MSAQTILIIDDDPDYCAAIGGLLESADYRVLQARNGREGLATARARRPDLIVLDVMMDEPTEGVGVLRELRADPSIAQLPVIVASSIYTEQPGFGSGPEADWQLADLFLAKPIDPARLLAEVARLIGHASTAASRAAPRK
jgi:CheY-like chemotaxis protein